MSNIRLSVVVTVVEGEEALRACLKALDEQVKPPTLEVIVPYDSTIEWAAQLACDFERCVLLPLGSLQTERPAESPAGQHELIDKRRSAGLRWANGEIIAIVEDRGFPNPEWAAAIDRLHDLPYAAIGGAVECGVDRNLNWAVYFCDFGRYQMPFSPGARSYLTDINIAYKRMALLSIRDLWESRYHETTVNWELLRSGEILYLSPEFVVCQRREKLDLLSLLRERFHWGRLFAYTRTRESSLLKRLVLVGASPFLPFVLFLRLAFSQFQKRVHLERFVRAIPAVVLLLFAWILGEFIGYVTGEP